MGSKIEGLNVKSSESTNDKSLRELRGVRRRCFADFLDPRIRRPALQPHPQFLHCGGLALRHDLDRPVRQIACTASDEEPLGFKPGAVSKIHTLDFPEDEKTADDFVQRD